MRRAEKIVDLLRLLAFQIGQEVSISELATTLALGRLTVERYLDLLEKVFVIFRTGGSGESAQGKNQDRAVTIFMTMVYATALPRTSNARTAQRHRAALGKSTSWWSAGRRTNTWSV